MRVPTKKQLTSQAHMDRETLGVGVGLSKAELRKRWLVLATALHPDHGGDAVAFNDARQAYKRLLVAAPLCSICKDTGRTTKQIGFSQLHSVCVCRKAGKTKKDGN